MNFSLLTKKPPGAHRRIVDAALVGLEHFHDQADDRLGREILAAFLAFGQGELAEEVFVDVAQDVLRVQVGMLEGDARDEINQGRKVGRIELELRVAFVENVLETRVFLFHGVERVVDQPAGGGDLVFACLAVLHRDFGARRQLGVSWSVFQRARAGTQKTFFSA